MSHKREGYPLPVPRYSLPTAVETTALRVNATLQDCDAYRAIAPSPREGRRGYRSYNTMHKARGLLMTCRKRLFSAAAS